MNWAGKQGIRKGCPTFQGVNSGELHHPVPIDQHMQGLKLSITNKKLIKNFLAHFARYVSAM
jgi:hypothetical protein